MKGSKKLIDGLNRALSDELTAISQYVVHAEMNDGWGYARLHEVVEKRARDEMKHAEKLIARILFLGGKPNASKLNPLHIGADVRAQVAGDLADEREAISLYNELVRLAVAEKDNGTADMLGDILSDEESHLDTLEAQTDQISQMGPENFLALQTRA